MTDKIKHTPGPWGVSLIASAHVVGPNNRGICSTGGYQSNLKDYHNENLANARLIAAAPEMFELIKRLAFCAGLDFFPDDDDAEKAREIIERIDPR